MFWKELQTTNLDHQLYNHWFSHCLVNYFLKLYHLCNNIVEVYFTSKNHQAERYVLDLPQISRMNPATYLQASLTPISSRIAVSTVTLLR